MPEFIPQLIYLIIGVFLCVLLLIGIRHLMVQFKVPSNIQSVILIILFLVFVLIVLTWFKVI